MARSSSNYELKVLHNRQSSPHALPRPWVTFLLVGWAIILLAVCYCLCDMCPATYQRGFMSAYSGLLLPNLKPLAASPIVRMWQAICIQLGATWKDFQIHLVMRKAINASCKSLDHNGSRYDKAVGILLAPCHLTVVSSKACPFIWIV